MRKIEIADNATNGDVIKAIFSPWKVVEHEYCVNVYLTEELFYLGDCWQGFDKSWWNAPYNQ